jgi:KDO2-lipid IV(A) lauroyltransferase
MIRAIASLFWLIGKLPYRAAYVLGGGFGLLLRIFALERRRVARTNLRLCFPEWDEARRRRLLRAHFMELGRSFIEYGWCWYASPEKMRQVVKVEGLDNLLALGDRPVILFCGHFTGLELAGLRLNLDVPMIDIYTNQKNPAINRWLLEKRARFGGKLVSRQEGVRPVLRALKEGYRLYYLPDQDLGRKQSQFIPFFGVPAATIDGLSRLAKASGAAVLPSFCVRRPDALHIIIEPPLENFPTDDALADTRRAVALLEEKVLANPAQYFWVHKRFKTLPEGKKRSYKR